MSYLITSVNSALIRVEHGADAYAGSYTKSQDMTKLKIGLRNLKAVLLVSRVTGYSSGHWWCFNALLQCLMQTCYPMADLLSRIEIVLDLLIHAKEIDHPSMAKKVHLLGEELDKKLSLNGIYQSVSLLTVDEVVGITDSVLDSVASFLSLLNRHNIRKQTNAFEAIDAFEIHIRFMKNVLVFAGRVDVGLQNALLLHIHPIVVNVARVVIMNDADPGKRDYHKCCSAIGSKCLEVNRMATEPQVYQAYSHALSMARLSSTPPHSGNETLENLLDSLISLLWDALRHALDSVMKDEFKLLFERLRFLRAVLKQQVGSLSLDGEIGGLVPVLVCDAGVLICSLHQPDADQLSDLLQRLNVFQAHVVASPTMLANDELGFNDFTTVDISDGNEEAPRVLGFHGDEVAAVLNRLTGGSKHLRIVPVCGMAGLGKTTFALKLYNHPSVLHHFLVHAWCTVSQDFDKKKVLHQLFNHIQPGDYSNLTGDNLANKLRQSLKGRRYLILLDDVWSPEVLDSLKPSFPDDFTGSRIILTSRHVDIAPHHLPDEHPHLLRLREDTESVKILQTKLFHKEGWSNDVGIEVAKICKGLPLTLVLISGLLATTEQGGWREILDHLSSGHSVSGMEQCNIALELGYNHLPDYLKQCFLYLGAFPEDEEVSVKTLIRLWMAEGFVIKNELKRLEDVGQEYVENLIERSLVMAGGNRSIGGVRTFRIHDLLHGFCQSKMKQDDLVHLLLPTHEQLLDFIEPCKLKRLSIHSGSSNFRRLRLFYPGALSLLFFREDWSKSHLFDMSFIIQICQLLKVLHMDEIVLINGIPNEIGLLAQLTYLSICTNLPIIPSSIGNLSNLETLFIRFLMAGEFAFPLTRWNFQKLKYLYIWCLYNGCKFLPDKNLENTSCLLELETLSGVVFCPDGNLEKKMQKLRCIRRLKCTILPSTEKEFHNIVRLDALTQLQSLSMRIPHGGSIRCEFGSIAENLRKLHLDGFALSKEVFLGWICTVHPLLIV